MLERFKVPVEDQVRVTAESLRLTVTHFFEKMGETPEDAATAADTLVTSDLRGVESHGVSNMVAKYMEYYQDGSIKARAEWRVVRETPGRLISTPTLGSSSYSASVLCSWRWTRPRRSA